MNKRVWYSTKANFNSPDVIHQILMYGTLFEIKSLIKKLGENTVKELFLEYPKKIYTAQALNFIKKNILHLGSSIDEQKYLKSTPRNIR